MSINEEVDPCYENIEVVLIWGKKQFLSSLGTGCWRLLYFAKHTINEQLKRLPVKIKQSETRPYEQHIFWPNVLQHPVPRLDRRARLVTVRAASVRMREPTIWKDSI